MTSPFSPHDVRELLSLWHKPDELTAHPLCQRLVFAERIQPLPARTSRAIAAAVQAVLQEALGAMAQRGPAPNAPRADAPEPERLLWRQYVEGHTVNEICAQRHMSPATYHRHALLELSALAAALTDMEARAEADRAARARPIGDRLPDEYVAREGLIRDVIAALTAEQSARTVVLTGLPGAGKTVLAAAVANHPTVRERFPDGVLWASLGQGGSPERCLREWLAATGISAPSSPAPTSSELAHALRAALAGKRMLFVIDDAWEMAAALALLIGCPHARHLVNTRMPALAHGLPGASAIEVEDLTAEECEALIRQFVDPALFAQAMTADGDLFARMDRLPLSVALAGRHLRYLERSNLTWRFEDVLRDPHHAALAHVNDDLEKRIALSVGTLDAAAQHAAAALAAFPPKPNTFTRDDALAIAACTTRALGQVIDAGLVESWHGRLTMHGSIHQYLRDHRADALRAAEARLITHFVEIVREDRRRLDLNDVANLAAAIELASAQDGESGAGELVTRSAWLFELAGQYDDLERMIAVALAREPSEAGRAALLAAQARLGWLRGRADAEAELMAQLQAAQRLGLSDVVALCEHTLSYVEAQRAHPGAAIALAEHALNATLAGDGQAALDQAEVAAVRRLVMRMRFDKLRNMMIGMLAALSRGKGNRPNLVLAQAVVAWLRYLDGQVDGAEATLRGALESPHARGNALIDAIATGALAFVCRIEGRYAEAAALAQRLIASPNREASPELTALAHDVLGQCALAQGDTRAALRQLHDGLAYADARGNPLLKAALHTSLCGAYLRLGDAAAAQRSAAAAVRIADLANDELLRCPARTLLALAAARSGDPARADELFAEARAAGRIGADKANRWSALQFHLRHGEHLTATGEARAAEEALSAAVALAQPLRARESEGLAWAALARARFGRGDRDGAAEAGRRGVEILTAIGHVDAAEVGAWLDQHQLTSHGA